MPMGDFICQGFVFLPMLQPNPVLINDILPKWQIKGLSLLPIVQGGMGLGVSAHRLAGSVARCGAVGTISSVDLRRLHPDLMQQTHKSRDKALIDRVNLVALDREIKAALVLADTQGLVAVNIMRAISAYSAQVIQACQSGAQALVVGAGLPLELPQLTKDYPAVALIPILSDVRGISILVKRWIKKTRLPDAIVIEHPLYAGGHLGVTTCSCVVLLVASHYAQIVNKCGRRDLLVQRILWIGNAQPTPDLCDVFILVKDIVLVLAQNQRKPIVQPFRLHAIAAVTNQLNTTPELANRDRRQI